MNLKNIKNNAPSNSSGLTKNTKLSFRVDEKPLQDKNIASDFRKLVEKPKKKMHKVAKGILIFLLIVVLTVGGYFGYFYYQRYQDIKNTGVENVSLLDPINYAISAATAKKDPLEKLEKVGDYTNFLLLGVDARGEFNSLLTDSIIVASYNHKTNETVQISLPRDMKVPFGRGFTKINSVFPFSYRDVKNSGKSDEEAFKVGFANLISAIEGVTNIKVHYGVMINFRGFKEIIDTLGGVTVDIKTGFTDYQYPRDDDKGVMTLTFKEGVQTLDGTKALQFARSRKGNNGEGSDYARARRQQIVVNAIKDKFINSNFFSQADSLNKILDTLGKNIKFYNVNSEVLNSFISAKDLLKTLTSYSIVIDPNFGSYVNQLLRGGDLNDGIGWVLYPVNGKYDSIKALVDVYMQSPKLLSEDAGVKLVWTNSKRYKDYTKLRNFLLQKSLKVQNVEGNIKVAATPTPSISPTTTPEPSFVSIYVNGDKPVTLEFYKKLLSENSYTYQVKDSANLPKELQKNFNDSNILIVID
jgi:LCP family protein required for cell wall assembly